MPDVEARAAYSPDGRYIAYNSSESGSRQVHLLERANPSHRWQITDDNQAELTIVVEEPYAPLHAGTTAVVSISIRAASSISPLTSTTAIAG